MHATHYEVNGTMIPRTLVIAIVGNTVYYRGTVDLGALAKVLEVKGQVVYVNGDDEKIVVFETYALNLIAGGSAAPAVSDEDPEDEEEADEDSDDAEEADDDSDDEEEEDDGEFADDDIDLDDDEDSEDEDEDDEPKSKKTSKKPAKGKKSRDEDEDEEEDEEDEDEDGSDEDDEEFDFED